MPVLGDSHRNRIPRLVQMLANKRRNSESEKNFQTPNGTEPLAFGAVKKGCCSLTQAVAVDWSEAHLVILVVEYNLTKIQHDDKACVK
jgi:hypothetical protein